MRIQACLAIAAFGLSTSVTASATLPVAGIVNSLAAQLGLSKGQAAAASPLQARGGVHSPNRGKHAAKRALSSADKRSPLLSNLPIVGGAINPANLLSGGGGGGPGPVQALGGGEDALPLDKREPLLSELPLVGSLTSGGGGVGGLTSGGLSGVPLPAVARGTADGEDERPLAKREPLLGSLGGVSFGGGAAPEQQQGGNGGASASGSNGLLGGLLSQA